VTSWPSARGSAGSDKLVRAFQDVAGICIRHELRCVLINLPAARGDALRLLRRCVGQLRKHQVEVADLVNETPTKTEIPVDRVDARPDAEVVETCFFADLAERSGLEALAIFDVALWKAPVVVAVPDDQEQGSGRTSGAFTHPHDDAARGGLQGCVRPRHVRRP